MSVLIVGLNPSDASPDNTPFHPKTKTAKILYSWLSTVDCDHHVYSCNLVNRKCSGIKLTEHEKLNGAQDIKRFMEFIAPIHGVITLGKEADKYLKDLANVMPYLNLPHPSGLNRKLNSKEYVHGMLERLSAFLKTCR